MDESLHIQQAERLFKDECTKRFVMMTANVNQSIKKYSGVVETLKENQSAKVEGDTYDYETDIKNTKGFVRDLKSLKK